MGPNTYPMPYMSSLVTEMPELPTVPWACLCNIRHNCISPDLQFDRSLRVLRQRQLIVGKIELQYGADRTSAEAQLDPGIFSGDQPSPGETPAHCNLDVVANSKIRLLYVFLQLWRLFYILREKIFPACNISLCRNVLILTLPV